MTTQELTRLLLLSRTLGDDSELRDMIVLAVADIRETRAMLAAVGEAIRKAGAP